MNIHHMHDSIQQEENIKQWLKLLFPLQIDVCLQISYLDFYLFIFSLWCLTGMHIGTLKFPLWMSMANGGCLWGFSVEILEKSENFIRDSDREFCWCLQPLGTAYVAITCCVWIKSRINNNLNNSDPHIALV